MSAKAPIKKFVEDPCVAMLRASNSPFEVDAVESVLNEYERLRAHHEEETGWIYAQARSLIEKTGATPRMYAVTKEAFIMRVATVLEMLVKDFEFGPFYEKHLEIKGSSIFGLTEMPDPEWSSKVAADALEYLT